MEREITELRTFLKELGFEATSNEDATRIYGFVEQKVANSKAREARERGECPTCGGITNNAAR